MVTIKEHKEEARKTLPRLGHTFHGSGLGLGAVEQLEQFLKLSLSLSNSLSLSHSLCLFVCPGMYALCVCMHKYIHSCLFVSVHVCAYILEGQTLTLNGFPRAL